LSILERASIIIYCVKDLSFGLFIYMRFFRDFFWFPFLFIYLFYCVGSCFMYTLFLFFFFGGGGGGGGLLVLTAKSMLYSG
jgi:hypothetical protein